MAVNNFDPSQIKAIAIYACEVSIMNFFSLESLFKQTPLSFEAFVHMDFVEVFLLFVQLDLPVHL